MERDNNVKKRIKPNEEVVAADEDIPDFIEKLPLGIASKIFSFLPVKTVFKFFTVKRSWLNLLNLIGYGDSNYAVKLIENSLKERRDDVVGFLLLMKRERRSANLELYLAEWESNFYQVSRIPTPVWSSHPNSMDFNRIVGSVNGLICLAKPISPNTVDFDPIYVYNPLLKEFVDLPGINNYSHPFSKKSNLAMGFGFYATTNDLGLKVYKYTIIRIYYRQPEVGEVEVFTLGDDVVWRSIASTPYPLQACKPAIFVDGSLYWLISGPPMMMIVSFDLDTETFGVLQPPPQMPVPDADTSTYLNEFGGKLCLTQVNDGDLCFGIFMNEDVAAPWIIKKRTLDTLLGEFHRFQPCYLMKNMHEVLVSCATLTREEVLGLSPFDDHDGDELVQVMRMTGKRMDDIFPHTHSFVSLRELGGGFMH